MGSGRSEQAKAFSTPPPHAKVQPTPFTVSVSEEQLQELKSLIAAGKIAPATYENSQQDRRLGLPRQWHKQARDTWLEFDWYRCHMVARLEIKLMLSQAQDRVTHQ